jgi:ADP-ribosyl-[dinitrogen reductase] hydrolase
MIPELWTMLIQSAIGDAYGAGFEFEKPEIIALENTLTHYKRHALYSEIQGRYTDDTQMALAISELILSGDEWTPERIADGFVAVFRRDPRRGYSSRFYEILLQVASGKALLQVLQPGSNRNGAAMRAYPIGIYADPEMVCERAAMQARITHDTPEGIASAQAVALASHYFLYRLGDKKQLGTYLKTHLGGPWELPWKTEVSMVAEEAVRAAITLLQSEDSLSNILRKGIALGGDVDTVGAIALGCGASAIDIVDDLPGWMAAGLENGAFGRDYILGIDAQLDALIAAFRNR